MFFHIILIPGFMTPCLNNNIKKDPYIEPFHYQFANVGGYPNLDYRTRGVCFFELVMEIPSKDEYSLWKNSLFQSSLII